MNWTALRCTLLSSLVFISTCPVASTIALSSEYSVRGVRLGMSIHGVLPSLSPDVASVARLTPMSFQYEDILTVTTGARCGWTEYRPSAPCIFFNAVAADGKAPLADESVNSVTFEQSFETPINSVAFEERLVAAYGTASLVMVGEEYLGNAHRAWLWSDDENAKSAEALTWLKETVSRWDSAPLKRPVLRVDAYWREGMIRGMRMQLFDLPRLLARSKQSAVSRNTGEARRANEAADQLKFK